MNYNLNVNEPEMLSVNDTAEKWNISKHYARTLALSGTVKAVRIGKGKILINQQSVADFFNSSTLAEPQQACSGISPIPVKLR